MAVNKVDYFGETLIDLTQDTVTPGNVAQGVTFHDKSGAQQVGTSTAETVSAGAPTVTPSKTQQVITPDTSKGENYLSQVTVNAIPYTETNNAAGGLTVTIGSGAS